MSIYHIQQKARQQPNNCDNDIVDLHLWLLSALALQLSCCFLILQTMTSNVVLRDTEAMSSTTAWFRSAISLDDIPKPALELLMQYTSLAPDAIVSHLTTVVSGCSLVL